MQEPTNTDIVAEIRSNHREVVTRLSAVEKQVAATNGRVLKLEEDKLSRDAVDKYRDKHPELTINTQRASVQWFESPEVKRFFLSLAALATAAAGFLALAVKGNG